MSNNILTLSLRPDVTVLAVPVINETVSHFEIVKQKLTGNPALRYIVAVGSNWGDEKAEPLPPGSYELIGLLREVTEDVLGELLICQDSVLGPGMVYWSYTSESFTCPTAIISMKDAIYKAGGDPKQNWLIILKK